ncbi:hypothetical protein [Stenotrophomonas sp.]|nr:hypothetical protein [Stenotrophomonas sp.]
MNSPQPIAIVSTSPFDGRTSASGIRGAITTTTITATISPVRPVVFA